MPANPDPGPSHVDLTTCDVEPIHIPGSIQPHGCLVVLDASLSFVERHSANAPDMLGCGHDLNGSPSAGVFGDKLVHDLRNALAENSPRPVSLLDRQFASGVRLDIAVHKSGSRTIVECEPVVNESDSRSLPLVADLVRRVARTQDLEHLLSRLPRHLRAVLGYDRVMIYQFQPDGAGRVVGEAKRSDLEGFLGLYFPATDIPRQARALYLLNPIRVISDASFERVPIVPDLDASGQPVDLSHAHLRSVSPIHCEYLQNMGVVASMSISVIVDGELWGLVACHHYAPRTLDMPLRLAAEMLGDVLSLQVSFLRQQKKLNAVTHARNCLDGMLVKTDAHDIKNVLVQNLAQIGTLIPCDGLGLCFGGEWIVRGETPAAGELANLSLVLKKRQPNGVWATDHFEADLPGTLDDATDTAGLLAIPLSQLPHDYLVFFRKELVRTVNWAGEPGKARSTGPNGDRLTPRTSFAIWQQSVTGQCLAWTETELDIAESARAILVEIFLRYSELLAEERKSSDVRQRMLNEELNHRVKNILAIVKSLAGQPVPNGTEIKDFLASFQGRVQALARAHDQVVRGDGGGMLEALLEAEVSAYRSDMSTVVMRGPAVALDSRAFSVLALVLHEMATNAAKYGALSAQGGTLEIVWYAGDNGDLRLDWRESGGPPVVAPVGAGFGSVLLRRSIPYDLGGESEVRFDEAGFAARFTVPARHVTAILSAPGLAVATAEHLNAGAGLDREAHVLLLEDQMLIAMDVEQMLQKEGFRNISTATSVREAMGILSKISPDISILDVNLGDSNSMPVAEELRRRALPFIFATGYSDSVVIPETLRTAPVVRKPYESADLMQALAQGLDAMKTARSQEAH